MDEEKKRRKRELNKERVRKYRTKRKRLDSKIGKPLTADDIKRTRKTQIEKRRLLSKERSRRYRERKRLHVLQSRGHMIINDSEIIEASQTSYNTTVIIIMYFYNKFSLLSNGDNSALLLNFFALAGASKVFLSLQARGCVCVCVFFPLVLAFQQYYISCQAGVWSDEKKSSYTT